MSKELPKGHKMSDHKDIVGQTMHRWKHHDPKPLHSGRGKGGKEGKIVKDQSQAVAIALSIAEKGKGGKGSKKGKGKTMDHSERLQALGFSEEVSNKVAEMLTNELDFTRCERPDGSSYGTGGKCRKGKEVAKKDEKKYTHEVHADLQRGFSKKAFKDYVDKWDGKIEGETDRGVYVRFPSESYARSFARNLKFDTRIKGVDVSEHDVNAIDYSEDKGHFQDFTRCVRPDGSSYGTGGKCRKGMEAKGPSLDEQIRDAYDREQAARRAGDHEGARAAMREHMSLVNRKNAEQEEKSLSRAWEASSRRVQDAERSGNPDSIRKAKLEETRMWDKLTAFRREQERVQKEAEKKSEAKNQAAEQRRGPRTLTQLQAVSLRLKRSIEKANEEYNKLRPFLGDPGAKAQADAISERIRKSVNLRGDLENRIKALREGSELGPKPRDTSPLGDMRRAAAAMGARD